MVQKGGLNCSSDDAQKGTRFLSTKAVSLLNRWFAENREYPYPDESMTDLLAREAGISSKQVKKWFANKRVRSQLCFKPIQRNRKKSHSGLSEHGVKHHKLTKQQIARATSFSYGQSYQSPFSFMSNNNFNNNNKTLSLKHPPSLPLPQTFGEHFMSKPPTTPSSACSFSSLSSPDECLSSASASSHRSFWPTPSATVPTSSSILPSNPRPDPMWCTNKPHMTTNSANNLSLSLLNSLKQQGLIMSPEMSLLKSMANIYNPFLSLLNPALRQQQQQAHQTQERHDEVDHEEMTSMSSENATQNNMVEHHDEENDDDDGDYEMIEEEDEIDETEEKSETTNSNVTNANLYLLNMLRTMNKSSLNNSCINDLSANAATNSASNTESNHMSSPTPTNSSASSSPSSLLSFGSTFSKSYTSSSEKKNTSIEHEKSSNKKKINFAIVSTLVD